MDDWTWKHFEAWLTRQYGNDYTERTAEKNEVRRRIAQLVEDDPELLKTHSWPEMRQMVGFGEQPEKREYRPVDPATIV